MEKQAAYDELKGFAEKRINAAAYQEDCTHSFDMFQCSACGGTTFAVTIERNESDSQGDFHGVLRTTCASCGRVEEKLRIEREGFAKVTGTESPRCDCGGARFHVALFERWENWGFFDEGTVVALCDSCGAKRPLVDTD